MKKKIQQEIFAGMIVNDNIGEKTLRNPQEIFARIIFNEWINDNICEKTLRNPQEIFIHDKLNELISNQKITFVKNIN